MQNILIAAAILTTVIAIIPYLTAIAKGTVKPRIATWFVWSLLAFISASASFISHQLPAAAFTLAVGFESEWVVLMGLRHGDRRIQALDVVCLIGAFGCAGLLFIANQPVLAIAAAVAVQFIGTIPTLVHSWTRPYEEKWLTYALYIPAEGMILLVANFGNPTAFIFPVYYMAQDIMLTAFSLLSPMRRYSPIRNSAAQAFANAESGESFNLYARHRGKIFGLPTQHPSIITGSQTFAAIVGVPFSVLITISDPPLPSSLTVTGRLATGLMVTDHGNGSATLEGTTAPGTEGLYTIAITAVNAIGAKTQNVTLTITAASPAPASAPNVP